MARHVSLLGLVLCFFTVAAIAAKPKTLAVVNGSEITEQDLKDALTGFNEGQRASILRDKYQKRQVLEDLIQRELLVQQAEKEKIQNSEKYQDSLKAFKKQLMATLLVEKKIGQKLTTANAKNYYKKNRFRFTTDEVKAYHILLNSQKEARKILLKAKVPNADFQALAEKYSKDPSAKNNRGDLGYFTRDRMVPEFSEAAFAAKEGSVVGPVKTAYGWHIIKVVDRKKGRALEFSEVEFQVKEALRRSELQTYVAELRKKSSIKRN